MRFREIDPWKQCAFAFNHPSFIMIMVRSTLFCLDPWCWPKVELGPANAKLEISATLFGTAVILKSCQNFHSEYFFFDVIASRSWSQIWNWWPFAHEPFENGAKIHVKNDAGGSKNENFQFHPELISDAFQRQITSKGIIKHAWEAIRPFTISKMKNQQRIQKLSM